MIVVSDTSPLCYLLLIEEIEVLPQLFNLLDDLAARRIATQFELEIVGLLGILGSAAEKRRIDFSTAIERLQQTTFRVSPKLIQSLLQQYQKDEQP
ncbi:DUF3368 domain-containing protein [Chroococcidiopsis sp. CCNUC1]|uniref:DUF3368 domain-containing protein n=1 Tax=Chroococcidiopsis sp. CCNUC1 TaxID=2653189 RepID=UPI0020208D67|nr:DUF3368 domain-containing protein [Chroococcidiopsis sp. CCNUC1]URD52681.1 DUF3368 domain-containing protein [Chroococcidiopsis sp. CCNUC1]